MDLDLSPEQIDTFARRCSFGQRNAEKWPDGYDEAKKVLWREFVADLVVSIKESQ